MTTTAEGTDIYTSDGYLVSFTTCDSFDYPLSYAIEPPRIRTAVIDQ